jgi:3-oxo-5-alpha-steroid 4-dehydrogenase 3
VPHTWFKHFYILSTCCSIFWGFQRYIDGTVFQYLEDYVSLSRPSPITDLQQLCLWSLVFSQSIRRLYESYAYAKPSKSSMWIGHWIMGLGFYFLINIAIWVESIPESSNMDPQQHSTSWILQAPIVFTVAFVSYCMYRQNSLHHYLFTLPPGPDYELPSKDEFEATIAPHYGYEVSIYGGIAVLGSLMRSSTFALSIKINWTLILAYLFVYVNLHTTAKGTRDWYFRKWGPKAIENKSLMISTSYFTTADALAKHQ